MFHRDVFIVTQIKTVSVKVHKCGLILDIHQRQSLKIWWYLLQVSGVTGTGPENSGLYTERMGLLPTEMKKHMEEKA